jgi:hypothetical protein
MADGSQELYGHAEVQQPSSVELYAKVLVQQPSEELYAHTIIRNTGSAEAYGHAEIRQLTSVEIYAHAIIRNIDSAEAYVHLVVRNIGSAEAYGTAEIRQETSVELYAHAIIRNIDSAEAYGHGIIRNIGSAETYGTAEIRQTRTLDLPGQLWVRWPPRFWTNRRYINGVIDLDEKLLGDAVLEYVIEGVMEDIQGYLENADLAYSSWTNITLIPIQILRATTYGVVAALYARHTQTFKSRVIQSIAPVTPTVIGDTEKAMNYWENRLNEMLELYVSSQGGLVMDTSTADEEPIFTMADIPEEVSGYVPWQTWAGQRDG